MSIGAVRLENTTDWYVMPGFPAIAHRDVVWALEAACRDLGVRYHVGLTATASGFYAPQGRAMRTLPVRYPELAEELRRQRVANLEMESSALFVLAGTGGVAVRGRFARPTHSASTGRFWKERRRRPRRHAVSRPDWPASTCSGRSTTETKEIPTRRWSSLIGARGGGR